MRKKIIAILGLLYAIPVFAQRGDELVVYAVKGQVVSIFQGKETPVRIGKVLVAGSVIKTEKGASLTMLCSKGRPISVTQEGTFPVNRWKDSCRIAGSSLSMSFFKYVWSQMYTYSPEHKEEMRKKSELAVVRGDEPPAVPRKKTPKIEFSKGMDTVYYDGWDFPLSWNGLHYNKPYVFNLYDAKGKLVFKTTTSYSYVPIDSFKHLLQQGSSYKWSVTAKGLPASNKRLLKVIPEEKVRSLLDELSISIDPIEDSASAFFRTAYWLEKRHYLAQAFHWYKRAMEAAPEIVLYMDQFIRFRNEFWIR